MIRNKPINISIDLATYSTVINFKSLQFISFFFFFFLLKRKLRVYITAVGTIDYFTGNAHFCRFNENFNRL